MLSALAFTQPIRLSEGWVACAGLTTFATWAQLFKALFKSQSQSGGGTTTYTPKLIYLFAGIFLLSPALFVVLALVPHLIDWAKERLTKSGNLPNWYIQPFNISTHLIAGLLPLWAYQSLGANEPLLSGFGMVAGAMLAALYLIINHFLVGQVLVLARNVTWRQAGVWQIENLLIDFMFLVLGYVVAVLWILNPLLILTALSPLFLIQRALMVPQLQRAEQELRQAKDHLESRVAERTGELQNAYDRLQSLSQKLVIAQEEERRRISRELHDQIGQSLTAVKINLQTLQRMQDTSLSLSQLEEGIKNVEGAMNQMRTLARDLRPSVLDDLGLVPALRSYIDRQAELAGFEPEIIIDNPNLRASPEVETACFRIVQEATTNVIRHAQARHVRVKLQSRDSELELDICDDGVGFDVCAVQEFNRGDGKLGLLGIQERAMLVGGRAEIASAPGAGTEIRVRVPRILSTDRNTQPNGKQAG